MCEKSFVIDELQDSIKSEDELKKVSCEDCLKRAKEKALHELKELDD